MAVRIAQKEKLEGISSSSSKSVTLGSNLILTKCNAQEIACPGWKVQSVPCFAFFYRFWATGIDQITALREHIATRFSTKIGTSVSRGSNHPKAGREFFSNWQDAIVPSVIWSRKNVFVTGVDFGSISVGIIPDLVEGWMLKETLFENERCVLAGQR